MCEYLSIWLTRSRKVFWVASRHQADFALVDKELLDKIWPFLQLFFLRHFFIILIFLFLEKSLTLRLVFQQQSILESLCKWAVHFFNRKSSREWDHGVTLQMELTKIIYHDHTSYGWGSLWYGSRSSAQLSCWVSNFPIFIARFLFCSSQPHFWQQKVKVYI